MEKLIPVNSGEKSCLYRIDGSYAQGVKRYVLTHSASRTIINQPEIAGIRFSELMIQALAEGLFLLPEKDFFMSQPEENLNVVTFLRGGLNFDLRRAISKAWGFNRHSGSFMTSQRAKDEYGRWYITQDQYRKLILPQESCIIAGDIIATGVTLENGLDIILANAKNLGRPIRALLFFTIGCHKMEKILGQFHAEAKEIFPHYQHTIAVYIEGKFHLADSKTGTKIKIQGTDLMRYPALLAPELLQDQFSRLYSPIERCIIYDGGSRAFDSNSYNKEMIEYWRQVAGLSDEGMSLDAYIEDRCPAADYGDEAQEYLQRKSKIWPENSKEMIVSIYDAWKKYHAEIKPKNSHEPHALKAFCQERIDLLSHPERLAEMMRAHYE